MFPLEPNIKAFLYARDVLKASFPEGEDAEWSVVYERDVLKNKIPTYTFGQR